MLYVRLSLKLFVQKIQNIQLTLIYSCLRLVQTRIKYCFVHFKYGMVQNSENIIYLDANIEHLNVKFRLFCYL